MEPQISSFLSQNITLREMDHKNTDVENTTKKYDNRMDTTAIKPPIYNLEERTTKFAQCVRVFIRKLPSTYGNREDTSQLVRSSGSVAANYIEANESLGKRDFLMKVRTCIREAKESRLWLTLIDVGNDDQLRNERKQLVQEAKELMLIFGSMHRKKSTTILGH